MTTGIRATTLLRLKPVRVIRQHQNEPRRELSLLRWGLIPSWAKDASVGAQMINEDQKQRPRNLRSAIRWRIVGAWSLPMVSTSGSARAKQNSRSVLK